ncbi:MAG: hypothetical protein QOD83_2029 [Solirubrobacteraceae bacterium]|jgi:hypothetical protein|nr:hypothetical protein [Solirubrobacteraceae bacterium]
MPEHDEGPSKQQVAERLKAKVASLTDEDIEVANLPEGAKAADSIVGFIMDSDPNDAIQIFTAGSRRRQ